MRKRIGNISDRILAVTSLILVAVVSTVIGLMNFGMLSLADSIALNIIQPMARTTAHNISENLAYISERLYLARTDRIITSAVTTDEEMNAFIETTLTNTDFAWLGLYNANGMIIAGSADSPKSISERSVFPRLLSSNNLSFEDTATGNADLEIVMGLPIHREWLTSIYLVGSYR